MDLWFISSLVFNSFIIIYFVNNGTNPLKLIPSTIFLISIIQYLCYSNGIITLGNVFDFGGVFKGFLYVPIGFYIGQKQEFPISKPLQGFVISLIFYWLLYMTCIAKKPMVLAIYY
jgi:hypothetical protein